MCKNADSTLVTIDVLDYPFCFFSGAGKREEESEAWGGVWFSFELEGEIRGGGRRGEPGRCLDRLNVFLGARNSH